MSNNNNIETFAIYSNYGKTINLLGLGSLNELIIYQSMLDDTIRASFKINDTGNRDDLSSSAVNIEEEDDLKITSGEKVELVLVDNRKNKLEFIGEKEFMVEQVDSSGSNTMVETFEIHLCTPDYIKNSLESSFVIKRYEGKISDTITTVLKEDLKTSKDIEVDTTVNCLPILGKSDKPFDFCTLLAPKSVPEKFPQLAGYFFYDTYNGYKFKSIDILFSQSPKRKMIYTNSSTLPAGYTTKIVNFHVENSMNVIRNLKTSTLSQSKLNTFDNYTNEYISDLYDSNDTFLEINNAGKEKPLIGAYLNLDKESSSIFNQIHNTGVLPPGSDLVEQLKTCKESTFNCNEIVRRSIIRYNQTFLLKAQLVIQGDFDIYPGDIIECSFPEISPKDLNLKVSEKKSGNYLVVDVSHLVNAEHCYTRLNIVRDTIMQK